MLVGIQPISEEDIFRKPHHILFWLYADMLNFGKKAMKFSQLHRHVCVRIDTHRERESLGDSAPGRRYLSGEMLHCLTHAGPLATICTWIVLLKDYVCRTGLKEHPCGPQGHPMLCGTVGTGSRCEAGWWEVEAYLPLALPLCTSSGAIFENKRRWQTPPHPCFL